MQPATWYERRVVLADALVAGVLILFAGVTGALIAIEVGGWAAVIFPLIASAALFVRRTYPVVMVSVIAVVAVVELLVLRSGAGLPSDLFVLLAVHTAARYCPRWFGWASLALAILGSAGAAYFWVYRNDFVGASPDRWLSTIFTFFALAALAIASFAIGRAQLGRYRAIQRQIASLGERNRLLQIEHEQAMALATEQERARLAAETHDILAHSLAIIVAQADGATMLADRDPARAADALRTIADTSREALAEVRLKVAALRDGTDPSDAESLAPSKTVRDIPDLIETVEAAGPRISLTTSGELERIPPGPSLAAYRIVQESLTNVLKHAGPRPLVEVAIQLDADALDVLVRDDGRGAIGDGDQSGNGLRGMRTRAQQYGGSLHAEPRVGGGFEVAAHLPIPRLTESETA
ncbi:sensor histidine kinase [Epidermidibacterium keratini]